jgi:hypothetical protein
MTSEVAKRAKQALEYTREGLDTLVAISELQDSLVGLPKNDEYSAMVKEIIEKEKLAVSLIQQATLIQRGLMEQQHSAIKHLIDSL